MDPNFKQSWVDALRSNNYTQGHGHLFNSTYKTYCCLGVALDLAKVPYNNGTKTNWCHFTNEVSDVLDISIETARTLILANDREYKTFAQIAELIEEIV